MDKVIGEVRLTDDFNLFESMLGNRGDAEIRSKKIEESVEQAGKYILAPIIVTDKDLKTGRYPIADGQARYTHCKKTNTPIAYTVVPGLTINDCIAMNASTSNWKLIDYIASFAARGIESYTRTLKFIEESPFGFTTSLWAIFHSDSSNYSNSIKNGSITVTQEMYEEAVEMIEYWKKFDDIFTNRKKDFMIAIGYCYLMDCVDNDMLVRKIHQRPRAFLTIASITDAIDVIEDCYNARIRDHVYIETEFYKFLDNKSGGNIGQMIRSKNEARQQKMDLGIPDMKELKKIERSKKA